MSSALLKSAAALVLVLPGVRPSPEIIVTGRVSNESSRAAIDGATISIPTLNLTARTGADGRYVIRVSHEFRGRTYTAIARAIGYKVSDHVLTMNRDTVFADFALPASQLQLSDVVVTGAGSQAGAPKEMGAVRQQRATVDAASSSPSPAPMAVSPRPYATNEKRAARDRSSDIRYPYPRPREHFSREQYDRIEENPFLDAMGNPRSTFSIDVDRASYSNVRRFIAQGATPPTDAVRIEEMVNYFPYQYAEPRGAHPVNVVGDVMRAPWNPGHRLVRIALQGRRMDRESMPANNLVFLLDVSGSMMPQNRLPLVKSAMRLLVEQLRPQDRVAIVVYAGNAGLVLRSTPGDRKDVILDAIDRLEAGGSTAGGAGIRLAYDVARENRLLEGNNRVILATDGDFNVGESSDAGLIRLIEEKRAEGTFLTVLGVGEGNLQDAKMKKLADHGNGNYAYLDDILEARKVLVHEMGGTLLTIAKDVKLQVEFNPSRVKAYRLIGYESRMLRDEDFVDDRKDAGELGAGHSVTALYEVIPAGMDDETPVGRSDSLRYRRPGPVASSSSSNELLYVRLRYKNPESDRSQLLEVAVADRNVRPSTDFEFAASVAEFGLLLRNSPHKGSSNFEDVLARARRGTGDDEFGYRAEFIRLVEQARGVIVARRD